MKKKRYILFLVAVCLFLFCDNKSIRTPYVDLKNENIDLHTNLVVPPIFINNTDSDHDWNRFALENIWLEGNGTRNNPYLLQNLLIDVKHVQHTSCIFLFDSEVFFVIRDCLLINALYPDKPGEGGGGIVMINVSNGLIDNNNFYSNGAGIYILGGANITITNNIIGENSGSGIAAFYSPHCQINNNFLYDCHSLEIAYSNYSKVIGITLSNINEGQNLANIIHTPYLAVSCSSNITVNENTLNKVGGIGIASCNHALIEKNVACYTKYNGLSINIGKNLMIRKNICSHNQIGIYLGYVNFSQIIQNTINNNSIYGIGIGDSSNNNFTDNELIGNERCFSIDEDSFNNNFFNNSCSPYDPIHQEISGYPILDFFLVLLVISTMYVRIIAKKRKFEKEI